MRRKKFYVLPLALLLVMALALVLAGCGQAEEQQQQPPAQQEQQEQQQQQPQEEQQTTTPSSESTATTTEQQAGQAGQEEQAGGEASLAAGKDYVKANCTSCHKVEGEGSGTDLSKVGSKYDAAALKDFLKSDKHPVPFKGSDEELEAVAQYLASLK